MNGGKKKTLLKSIKLLGYNFLARDSTSNYTEYLLMLI